MSGERFLIGTDVGTLGTKTVLVGTDGATVASAFEEYDVLRPKPLWAEQWPNVWFDAVAKTIRDVMRRSRISAPSVAGLCISGLYGGSGIPLDSRGKPLRPCLIWLDRRATKEVEWVKQNLDLDELFRVTANTVDPYYGFTKMLWIKFNEPEVWRKIDQILTPNAYCIYRLTGSTSIDYSSAGNYGGIFDIHKRNWSEKMMDALGIPRSFFPDSISMSKDVVGELSEEGARLTGLRLGTPVSAGGIDAPVSALSTGVLRDGDLSIMLGTSMCNGFIQDTPRLSPRLINYPHVAYDRQKTYSFAGVNTAGACIRYFRDEFGSIESTQAKDRGMSAYALLDLEAEEVPVGSDGLIFLPHMMGGERAPWWDPSLVGCLIGLTLFHTRAHIFRAFLEGIAYALRYSVETALNSGMPLKRVLLVDGGSKSRLWRRILTDVTGLPMAYIAEAPGAPLGDALLAGVGAGVVSKCEEIDDWLKVTETTQPNEKDKSTYEKFYKLYNELYEANSSIFEKISRIR